MKEKKEIWDEIERLLQKYLSEKEREIEATLKKGVEVKPCSLSNYCYTIYFGGYEVVAEYKAKRHRWNFYLDNVLFLNISEKKGETIIQFLKNLASATKK